MNSIDAQSKTETSESYSKKAEEMLAFGSKLALDTILGLDKKIGGQTEGVAHE